MQLTSAVQSAARGGRSSPAGGGQPAQGRGGDGSFPQAVGHTFFSSNPAMSAAFFMEYFDAQAVPLAPCEGVEQAGVDVNLGLGSRARYVFVKDGTKPAGHLSPEALVPRVEASIVDAFQRGSGWSSWIDNHDGVRFSPELFQTEKALADGVAMVRHESTLRLYIPYTLWTFEWRQAYAYQEYPMQKLPIPTLTVEGCRAEATDPSQAWNQSWSKVTFMTADLQAAADFATTVLGAVEVPSTYPTTLPSGCAVARWFVTEPDIPMLHFVDYGGNRTSQGVMGDKQFAEYVESLRDMDAGTFDQYMYNSLVLSVSSLDPYVLRVKRQALPHLLLRVNPEQVALFVDVPRNGIVFQLRSAHLSVAAPGDVSASASGDVCLPQFDAA